MFRKRLLFKLKTKLKKKKDMIINTYIHFWGNNLWSLNYKKYKSNLTLFSVFFSKTKLNFKLNKNLFDSNQNLSQELPSFSTLL